jgi:hypothetical protein
VSIVISGYEVPLNPGKLTHALDRAKEYIETRIRVLIDITGYEYGFRLS